MTIEHSELRANENTAVLASAIELGSQSILGALGNEISDQVGDNVVSLDFIRVALAARLKATLAPRLVTVSK